MPGDQSSPDETSDDPSGSSSEPTVVRPLTARQRAAGQPLDEEARIIAHLATLPPDTRTRVYRTEEGTKVWQEVGILSPSEVNQEWIARRWGGGTYQIRVIDITRGPHIYSATSTWIIPGPYKGVGSGVYGLGEPQPAPAGSPDAGTGRPMPTRELFDSVLATRAMEIIQQDRRDVPTSKGPDLVGLAAVITACGAILSPVILKLLSRGPDPALERLEREVRAIRAQPGPAASALADAMKGIREVVSLRDTLDGVSGGKASTVERLLDLVPAVLEAWQGRAAAPAPGAPPVPAPSAPLQLVRDTPGGAPGGPTVDPSRPPWEALLLSFRDQLLYMANNGWEPEYCADLVQRTVPADFMGILTEYLQRDDADAILVATIPELGAFAKWRPAFLAECKRLLLGEPDDETLAPPTMP